MLSYKLKHLCSRVIASLSAVGLISITNTDTANAVTYKSGESITNKYSENTVLFAKYEEKPALKCSEAGMDTNPDIYATYSGTYSGATTIEDVCVYVLQPGYGIVEETGNCLGSTDTSTKYYSYGGDSGCQMADYSGATISGLIYESGDAAAKYLFTQVLTDYQSGRLESIHQSVVRVVAGSSGTAYLDTSKIVKKEIRINFNCENGNLGFASQNTGVAYTKLGWEVTMPSAENCVVPSGMLFSGWSDVQ